MLSFMTRIATRHMLRMPCRNFSCAAVRLSAEAKIAAPSVDGSEYDPKIQSIVDSITELKLHEVAALNDLLKKSLGISDVPMMAAAVAAPVAAAAPAEEEEAKAPERTEFNIKLTAFTAASKIKLIKAVKAVKTDLNLVQAKKFVESLPQVLKEDVSKEDCEEIKKQLEEAGGTVELV